MRDAEVIVVGLGGIGSAALHQLALRGRRVIGLEKHHIGHERGSSHGLSRVIRKAYSEHPGYVPMLHRAYELWRALESETGADLLSITGAVHLGPPDHDGIRGVLAAVSAHELPHQVLTAADIRERFPAMEPGARDIGIVEDDAGVLAVERAVAAHVTAAVAAGADVRLGVTVEAIDEGDGGVTVGCASGETLRCDSVVVCVGAWLAEQRLASLPIPLVVTRQVQCWFAPTRPELFTDNHFAVFIHFIGEDSYYGLPPGPLHAGVKVCRHYGGEPTTAETLDRQVRAADEEEVRWYLRRHLPGADGPMVTAEVCMYTSTPDHHFVVGPVPGREKVIVAGGFSGHGFKLAPVIGEIAADLATGGGTDHDISLFDPRRFSV